MARLVGVDTGSERPWKWEGFRLAGLGTMAVVGLGLVNHNK